MNQKQRSNKEIMLLILFIAVVGWGVLNFSTLIGFVTAFIGMLKPFVIGAAMAFVINLPLNLLKKKCLVRCLKSIKGPKEQWELYYPYCFLQQSFILWLFR